MNEALNHKLIVTIVNKGAARKVVTASKKAGAQGGTVLLAKGSGIHELTSILGIQIEPEKELILTLVSPDKLDVILDAIVKAGKLDRPGYGISFVLDTKKIAGIHHLLRPYP